METCTDFERRARSRAYVEHLVRESRALQSRTKVSQVSKGGIVTVLWNRTNPDGLTYQTLIVGQAVQSGRELVLDYEIDPTRLDDAILVLTRMKKWWKAELKKSLPPWWQRLAQCVLTVVTFGLISF